MKTPLTYYGGKQRMLPHILPLVPAHEVYVEPFAGGAAVFWAKAPAPIEVLNDTNRALMTFYSVAQRRSAELAERITATAHSRSAYTFSAIIYQFPEFFGELDLAWAVWMQCQQSFAASIRNAWGYARTPSRSGIDPVTAKLATKRATWSTPEQLQQLTTRLGHVQLECADALQVVRSRDSAATFHYIDPPYPGTIQGHYAGYSTADFVRLLELLPTLRGRFLLSCYPRPELTAAAQQHGWHVHEVRQAISAGLATTDRPTRGTKTEVLVANYPLSRA